jgi:MFS family permease
MEHVPETEEPQGIASLAETTAILPPGAPPAPAPLPGTRRARLGVFEALRVPNFRLYFVGQAISLSGTWMQSVAQAWLVLELTSSAAMVGTVVAIQTLPVLLVGPFGGVVADRADKRALLVVLQLVMGLLALILAVLTLTGRVQLWQVFVLAFVLGSADSFEKPARQSFIVEIVGPETVRNAVSLNSVMVNGARIVGPALAGLMIAAGGLGLCFLLNAVSYVPVALLLIAMNKAALRPSPRQEPRRGQLRAGFAYVRHTRALAVPLIMMAIIGCFTYEFPVTLPVLAKEGFGGDSRTYGFMTAVMGLGAVIGGLYTAARGRTGISALVRSSIGFGIVVLATALAPTVGLALLGLLLVGASSVRVMAQGNTTLQLAAEPHMRGRVMSLWLVAFLGTTPIGGPLVGWVAGAFGARWGLILGAVACFAAAAIGVALGVRDRRVGTLAQ